MNVIFLDVDGVLNSQSFLTEHIDDDVILDESKVELLEKLVKATDAKIVLSSSWRLQFTPKGRVRKDIWTNAPYTRGTELKKLLKKHGIKIIGRTKVYKNKYDNFYDKGERKDEIQEYIDNHQSEIDNFVVIDDEDFVSANSPLLDFGDRFIHTKWKFGLQERDIKKALKVFEN